MKTGFRPKTSGYTHPSVSYGPVPEGNGTLRARVLYPGYFRTGSRNLSP